MAGSCRGGCCFRYYRAPSALSGLCLESLSPMLRTISSLFKLSLFLLIMLVAAGTWYALQPLSLRQPTVDFEIARGESMKQIARKIADAGVEVWPPALVWLARISGHSVRIKAGSYRIDKPIAAWDLVALMSTGANA